MQCNVSIRCEHNVHFADARDIASTIPGGSINLVVTSPPYFQIKDYGDDRQIGHGGSLRNYRDGLVSILGACCDALKPAGYLCVNIGNQFVRSTGKTPYHTIPLHEYLVSDMLASRDDLLYQLSIIWRKVTTSNTSGGGKVMGSIPYPRNPRIFQNREYVAVFQKVGKNRDETTREHKLASGLSMEERRTYASDTWDFPPERQDIHEAMFPVELPKRLIRLYTMVGDSVLDPFGGSCTTTLAAAMLGRHSIAFEVGFVPPSGGDFRDVIKNKIQIQDATFTCSFTDNQFDPPDVNVSVRVKNAYHYH